MANEKTNFVHFTDMLEGAIAWLEELDIEAAGTRYAQYLTELRDAVSKPDLVARTDDPRFERILEAFDSGGDLLVIQRDLAQYDSPELRRRLAEFVKGPFLQREERAETGSNLARNLGFELIFAAQLVRARFRPVLPVVGDLCTDQPEIRFECKRIQNERKLGRALRVARDQLNDEWRDASVCKVIAVSLGKSIHGGQKFLHGGDHDDVHRKLRELFDQVVRRHEHLWRADSFQHVGGIWFHYSGSAVFSRLNAIVRATYNRVVVRPSYKEPEREAAIRILAAELEKNLDFGPF